MKISDFVRLSKTLNPDAEVHRDASRAFYSVLMNPVLKCHPELPGYIEQLHSRQSTMMHARVNAALRLSTQGD